MISLFKKHKTIKQTIKISQWDAAVQSTEFNDAVTEAARKIAQELISCINVDVQEAEDGDYIMTASITIVE